MRRTRALAHLAAMTAFALAAHADPWPSIPIPPENAASLRSAPTRPPPGDLDARARHLATALANGDTDVALDFFFPHDPFIAVKDIGDANGYFRTLIRWYRRDIEQVRHDLPAGASVEYVRFDLSRHCVWMTIGREANRLPYWSCYGSRLVVRVNGEERTVPVHVMINWGTSWYATHLGAIPQHH